MRGGGGEVRTPSGKIQLSECVAEDGKLVLTTATGQLMFYGPLAWFKPRSQP
jgi:hypothetical protein